MSTYYYLVCDEHHVRCPLVSLRSSDGSIMARAEQLLPSFIHMHDDHHGSLRVVQEDELDFLHYPEHRGAEKPPDEENVWRTIREAWAEHRDKTGHQGGTVDLMAPREQRQPTDPEELIQYHVTCLCGWHEVCRA
jgi:hypothetical protein